MIIQRVRAQPKLLHTAVVLERAPVVQANMDANVGLAPMVFGDGIGKSEPIAIVGFGPSLKQTWEQLRSYRYIWTVSGAHDFLLERGIVPTYHTDVDWKDHKPGFIKQPHPDVEYRMCNGVHPTYVEKLKSYNLKMFEPADMPADIYRPIRQYPEAPKAGNAGQQAAILAHLDGWQTQHWFGLDHSYEYDGVSEQKPDSTSAIKHAGAHSSKHLPPPLIYVNVVPGGRYYETSYDLLAGAKLMLMLMKQYKLKPKIIGDGLLKEWVAIAPTSMGVPPGMVAP